MMKKKRLLVLVFVMFPIMAMYAQSNNNEEVDAVTGASQQQKDASSQPKTEKTRRLTLGGYGEATYSRMFYSDSWKRYSHASEFKDAPSHGRFDLPHVVFNVGYDFGKGWTMGTEIEFEHGGAESAVEIEEEETGEYETEVERGGEVALEQFWINKSFWQGQFNIKLGHIIVPVGLTNSAHEPDKFFTVHRPEGERTILPCTWHQTGVSLWGRTSRLRYEAQFLTGLQADLFGSSGWANGAAASPYEFDIANSYAVAARLDWYAMPGLKLGVSGYYGKSAANTMQTEKYSDIKGRTYIGTFDLTYSAHNWIARANVDYGHIEDSEAITKYNMSQRKESVSPKTAVASDAMCAGVEVGYNMFALVPKLRNTSHQLFLFGRYDYYDSMFRTAAKVTDNPCWERHKMTFGLNYKPIKEVIVKAEYSKRFFHSQYNNEPTISLGVAYCGFFKL